jgi:hypothetical protein
MDDLIKKRAVVGADLVKAVTALLPGDSIAHVLDAVRHIILKRVVADIKSIKFSTVIHLVAHLKTAGLTPEDAKSILTWIEVDPGVPSELRESVGSLLTSGLLGSVFDFVAITDQDSTPTSCFCLWKSPKQSRK